MSFVKIGGRWHVFDIYNRQRLSGDGLLAQKTPLGPTYIEYLESMDSAKFDEHLRRPDKQKFVSRVVYEAREIFYKAIGKKR